MAAEREHKDPRKAKFERYFFLRARLRDFGAGAVIIGATVFSSGTMVAVGLLAMTAAYLGGEGGSH